MDQGTSQIREDVSEIVRTRAAMTDKLEQLEQRVHDTVEEAKAAALDVVDSLKGTADDMMQRTRRAFDPLYQTQQHPWLMMAAVATAGYFLGRLMASEGAPGNGDLRNRASAGTPAEARPQSLFRSAMAPIVSELQQTQQAILADLASQTQQELHRIGAALSVTVQTFLREIAREAVSILARPLQPSPSRAGRPYPEGQR